ncbi:MAG: ABC transporter permease, partial [Chloroflexi bacterium]|nr:ABC transporter permease [Chloroflexota bacterium]
FFGIRLARNSTARTPNYNPVPAARYAAISTADYVDGLLHGELGTMLRGSGRQRRAAVVRDVLADVYPKSLGLLTLALLLATGIGVPLGAYAALRRRKARSTALMTLTLVGISLPSFTAAALLQVGEIYWFRAFGFRLVPVGGFGWDAHLVIPTLVLAARPLAHLARISYMAFYEVLEQDYMRTAEAKGLLRRAITLGHAYPNAAVPVLTGIGVSVRYALASLPVVEYFIGWPGIGAALLDAIRQQQAQAVAGLALALGLTFMLLNLTLEVLYRVADPRLRGQRL